MGLNPNQANRNLLCHPNLIFLSFLPPKIFPQELERLDEGLRKADMAVHARHDWCLFEDSYRELHRKSPEEMKTDCKNPEQRVNGMAWF